MEILAIGNDGHGAAGAKNAIFYPFAALNTIAHRLLFYPIDMVKERQELLQDQTTLQFLLQYEHADYRRMNSMFSLLLVITANTFSHFKE